MYSLEYFGGHNQLLESLFVFCSGIGRFEEMKIGLWTFVKTTQ